MQLKKQILKLIHEAGKSFVDIVQINEGLSKQIHTVSVIANEVFDASTTLLTKSENVRESTISLTSDYQMIAYEEQLASMEEVTASMTHLSNLTQELQDIVNRFKL